MIFQLLFTQCRLDEGKRETISLNGIWQIAEGQKDVIPEKFERTVPVPGLVTLAEPSFINPAPSIPDTVTFKNKLRYFLQLEESERETYWYRRTFILKRNIPEVVLLKVAKAMFGTRVYLNGTFVGEHLPCFTPGYFDLAGSVHKGENELIIAVGASGNSLPPDMPDGFDYEKARYISGIFDNVDLILSGTPFIRSVQVAPDIYNKRARIQTILENKGTAASSEVRFVIREAESGIVAGEFTTDVISLNANSERVIDISIPINDCKLWSPEIPFLYNLEVTTRADLKQTRFGMRELRFDSITHMPVLNGAPYFLRGTNVTLYRFFEDPSCAGLPWDYNWVRTMHRKFKTDMYWNSYRNCIGFPPEEWYNIADEEGFLIQDEFPIWYGGTSWNNQIKVLNKSELAGEFKEWMQERWNHPSVVIWDASNETRLEEPSIDSAIAEVRPLDLSRRSWDNSYSPNRLQGDIFESHPYHFSNSDFRFKDIAGASIIPQGSALKNDGTHPVIINEYGWLWLNRDGSPTTLTQKLYENITGPNSTAEERWDVYARYFAAETEFWRCHRKAAGVMHFTSLGYARPNGQTCDNWIDIKNLTWEPRFLKYVSDAFCPLGLMVDFWADEITGEKQRDILIKTINDIDKPWHGEINFRVLKEGNIIQDETRELDIPAFGQQDISFDMKVEVSDDVYTIEASLLNTPYGTVKSIRDFKRR